MIRGAMIPWRTARGNGRMKFILVPLVIAAGLAGIAAAEPIELKQTGKDRYRFMADRKELAELMPVAWQGNLNIFSTRNRTNCGVNWSHLILYSEGKWLTDKVESEGMKLVEFKPLAISDIIAGYRGKWRFRDDCFSSECHFAWFDATNATQVHYIRTQLEFLKDVPELTSAWVEFMTWENSYTTVAARTKGGVVVTLNVSGTGTNANMHYLDGLELADDGWIAIYGARKGQETCVAMVPLSHSGGIPRPRVNNGHVDNIEIHLLDARKQNPVKKGATLSLEYLLIVGPDRKDWKWIEPAAREARAFVSQNAALMNCSP